MEMGSRWDICFIIVVGIVAVDDDDMCKGW